MREFDRQHLWHPYAAVGDKASDALPVTSASGVRLTLEDGSELIDGMSSWWAAIHGYNHPTLNKAAERQLAAMSHVMFGGLTHRPAVDLGKTLLSIVPEQLNKIFYCDSGSVAVEVAIKMAYQYWLGKGQTRTKLLALQGAYHGDTFAAMSVCDPVNGMHKHFAPMLAQHLFAPRPQARFHEPDPQQLAQDIAALRKLVTEHRQDIIAIIIEPILQGAGGMWFYCSDYLAAVKEVAAEHQLPIIADEIATGFGRAGKLFACQYADLAPDILCLGKAMSGGYLSIAAVLCQEHIAQYATEKEPGALQHGPTFMANPLACAIANANIKLLLDSDWQSRVQKIEQILSEELSSIAAHPTVADVRCLGATGVIEFKEPPNTAKIQASAVADGVWLRPFGKLLYTMPPYISTEDEVRTIAAAMCAAVQNSER